MGELNRPRAEFPQSSQAFRLWCILQTSQQSSLILSNLLTLPSCYPKSSLYSPPSLGGPQAAYFHDQLRIAHLCLLLTCHSVQDRGWVSVFGQIIWHQCTSSWDVTVILFCLHFTFFYFHVCKLSVLFWSKLYKDWGFTSHYMFPLFLVFPHLSNVVFQWQPDFLHSCLLIFQRPLDHLFILYIFSLW